MYLVSKYGKATHIWTDTGPACGQKQLDLNKYRVADKPEGEICKICALKTNQGSSDSFVLDRPDVLCKCCGRQNHGSEDLQWGFYCGQCGQFWKYRVPVPALPPLRESGQSSLPWE